MTASSHTPIIPAPAQTSGEGQGDTQVNNNVVSPESPPLARERNVGWFFVLDIYFILCSVVTSRTKNNDCIVLNKLELYTLKLKNMATVLHDWKHLKGTLIVKIILQ